MDGEGRGVRVPCGGGERSEGPGGRGERSEGPVWTVGGEEAHPRPFSQPSQCHSFTGSPWQVPEPTGSLFLTFLLHRESVCSHHT